MGIFSLFQELPAESAWRALVAFALVFALIPLTLAWAHRFDLVDRPGGRKQHDGAIPVTGGVVIFFSVVATYFLFEPQFNMRTVAFIGGAAMLVAVGMADDVLDLRWTWRIGAQALAGLGLCFLAGVEARHLQDVFGFAGANMGWLAVPFTIFIVVGVINALNMSDGVDGLAGSLALASLMLFTCFALYSGDGILASRLLAISAAVLGFLVWNHRFPWQPRARVFLGNGGSMLLGFIIAWASVRLTQNPTHPVSPVLGPWTLSLPLIDCVALMFRRLRNGQSPFKADRNHMHHLLLEAGYGPTVVVLVIAGGSLATGIAAAVAVKLGVYRPLLVVAFFFLLGAWYLFSRDRGRTVQRLRRLRRFGRGPLLKGEVDEALERR